MSDPTKGGEGGGMLRVLGTRDAMCVVIGAIIGVGIFFTPSRVAAVSADGGFAMLAWIVAGGIALCGALAFAELGGMYHAPGAQYEILRDSYGPFPAFLFVFCNATAVQAGAIGVIAVICTENLIVASGRPAGSSGGVLAVSIALIGLVTLANALGVRWGARIQNFTVYAKVLTLLVITGLALLVSPEKPVASPDEMPLRSLSPFAGLLAALTPAFFAFGGWQHALWISGEVKNPSKALPRAIVGGVLVVIMVYLLANWAYLDLLGFRGVATSKSLAADAVGSVFPSTGRRVIAGAVALSAFGVLNAQLLSGPRLVYAAARDGRFFAPFARLSARFGTPVAAILLLTGVAVALLLAAGGKDAVDRLTTGVVLIDGVFFGLTGIALFVLRRKKRDASRSFRVPLYPVVPALFVIGELGLIVGAFLEPSVRVPALIAVGWIGVAGVLYAARFRRGSGS
ncbi:MAG: amino acid permease [Phycisphaeraceae bacterium]|nr:amino acid permease [Phycisphaeraceae bacterium]